MGPSTPSRQIRFSEVISALSFALDLVEGQPEGHAVRSCLLGMRLAREIGMPESQLSALFYALLLKDLGCSSNSAKVCSLFAADDRTAKRELKVVDWSSVLRSVKYIAKNVATEGSIGSKVAGFVRVASGGTRVAKQLVQCRCERGASIVRELGLPDETADAIYHLDEHWNGHGHPAGVAGLDIPIGGRILNLAQTFEVFHARFGKHAAYEMARDRSGGWFDPELVRALHSIGNDTAFWQDFAIADPRAALPRYQPDDTHLLADDQRLDQICSAFAKVIDAKSPWTYCHSAGVSEVACGVAGVMGMSVAQVNEIRRAGLLHDIGKLGISNMILDKPGRLTADEIAVMRKHPAYTFSILERVGAFRSFADLAASHHERIDGKGYHRGVAGTDLSLSARILCVADMYEALAAKRPYRQDLSEEQVFEILRKNEGAGLCPNVLEALTTYLDRSGFTPIALPLAA